ncbi:cyclic di-GMP phosphodiesterase Gmr [mine drainage metagenome]|uniref:Cyclic di-GMP phosphodiesterase Gmr n=1 Tax=mine drainage metagenome TaxID=410659 RepID=A0A1J5TNC0_9ZZZZ
MSSIDIFPWNDNFNTGIPKIDEQHKKLAQLLNLLASHVAFQSNIPALNVIFDELAEYAVYHFNSEEKIWDEYLANDPIESAHHQFHNSFLTEVLKLKAEENTKPANKVIEEVLAFLTRWLAAHILESDRYMATIVQAMQSGMLLDAAKKYAAEKMRGATKALIDIILSIYESLSTNTLHLMRELAEQKRMALLLDDQERHFETLISITPVGVFETNKLGKYTYVNAQWSEITGLTSDLATGSDWTQSLHPEDKDHVYAEWTNAIAENRSFQLEYRILHANGEYVWVFGQSVAYKSKLKDRSGYISTITDITKRKQTELALQASHQQINTLLNSMAEGAYGIDAHGYCTFVNQSFLNILGYTSSEEVIGKHIHELIHHSHPDGSHYPASECLAYKAYRHNENIHVADEVFWRKDGTSVFVEYWSQPIFKHDILTGAIATFIDITERKQAEHQQRVAATAFESQEGMMVTDANNVILRVNRAFTRITGYEAEDAVGQTPRLLSSGHQDKLFYKSMWEHINNAGEWEGEIWNRRKNGEVYPEHLTITAVKDTNGIVTNYVATLADITLSKAASDEIKTLAFYDPLTRLPNRRLLVDRLRQALASSARSGQKGALLFIDLDHFKTLNDTLGHDVGDQLLKQVADRLTACVREDDTVARLGGDEFVVLLEGLNKGEIEAAAHTEAIGEKILHSLSQTYRLGTYEHHSTPSIGVTLFDDHQFEVETLLKQADIAMYEVKSSGRNALRFFDPKMQEAIAIRVDLEQDLRKAIELKQFQLYYQIQVNSAGKTLGAEVLIRWPHPKRGMISPSSFIPLAEETGLILPIGQWVLDAACAQLKLWQENAITRDLTLSVNVSAKQFLQKDFVEQVQMTVQRHNTDPTRLKLELTESMLINKVSEIIAKMNALGEIGIKFSLDDFGTGYSSLQYLKQLPLYQLKIDQSFVRDITNDVQDQAIVRTIIAMANSLNLSVIAEGVETETQRRHLLNAGCTHYQGYLFSKPIPIHEFEQLLIKNE